MKRALFVGVLCALLVAPAMADMKVTVANVPGGDNNGGPFTATVTGTEAIGENAVDSFFRTFCLEKTITYYPNVEYYATVDAGAIAGGVGGNPDVISHQTAWLYTQYLDGLITNGSAVQEAIWRFEDEGSYPNADADALQFAANAAVNGDGWTNTNIRAMNLWSGSYYNTDGDKQSMLVRVPVPAAVWLGLLGLGAAGAKLRRRRA